MLESLEVILSFICILCGVFYLYKKLKSIKGNKPIHSSLLYDRWDIYFSLKGGFPSEYPAPSCNEPAQENIHHILLAFENKSDTLILKDMESEQFLQTTSVKKILDDKSYYVEYRPPNEEILYCSVENLSFKKTFHLFEMMINGDATILEEIKWKDTGFL